jgi:hypothetical protein
VVAISEFIGTFKGYEKIPEMFKMISYESIQKTPCRFLLQADPGQDKNIQGLQYYGLRSDVGQEKNSMFSFDFQVEFDRANSRSERMFEYLSDWCRKQEAEKPVFGKGVIESSTDNALHKYKQDGYTNNWKEWVGIDPLKARAPEGGCVFELEVETQLGRPPRVGFLSVEWFREGLTFDS